MNLTILDKSFEPVLILDSYHSLIWTDRYSECGDFEITTAIDEQLLKLVQRDYYIVSPESSRIMCIETIRITTDPENGSYMTLQGNSFEKVLSRRIVWGNVKLEPKKPHEIIKELLTLCIINPENEKRKIDNFVFKDPDPEKDSRILGLEATDAQYTGDNLYDIVVSICKDNDMGFKITYDDENGIFTFELYDGVDRSYNQVTNSYVIFSPSFDNLVTANYMETRSALKTVALVKGASDETEVDTLGLTGIDRRELYVDARDITDFIGTLTGSDDSGRVQRGKERLAEYTDISSFEGQAETRIMFKYEQDFYIGDIVQFADGYGHEASARIVEMITSDNEEGVSVYPTFKTIQKEGE